MNLEKFRGQIVALSQQVIALDRKGQLLVSEPVTDLITKAMEELSSLVEERWSPQEERHRQRAILATNQQAQPAAPSGSPSAPSQWSQSLFEFAPDAYLVTDASGRIEAVNRVAAKLLHRSPLELVGQPLTDLIPELELNACLSQLQGLSQGDWLQEWEVKLHPGAGSTLEVAVTVAILSDVQGELLLSWLLRDIGVRKQAAQQLQALNLRLSQQATFEKTLKRIRDHLREHLDEAQILQTAVQELAVTLNLICCDTAVYDVVNGTSTIVYQYTKPGLATPSTIGQSVVMESLPVVYRQLLQDQPFQFCELTPNSVRRQCSILACPIFDHEGAVGDLWCFSARETALNEVEVRLVQEVAQQCAIAIRQSRLYQQVQAELQELNQVSRLKDSFLSTISHELRTPLANIKLAVQMLQTNSSPARQERYLNILQAECDREIDLITNLLDLQRLETHTYPTFLHEAVALPVWLPIVAVPFARKMHSRQQTLIIEQPPTSPTLVTDRSTLNRILSELLTNAYKYTPTGGEVRLRVEHSQDLATTTFTIRNQSTIPVTALPRIFDKFYRVPSHTPWEHGGTGLGLALVQQLVEQLQGTLKVNSHNGWTTFIVELPTQPHSGFNENA